MADNVSISASIAKRYATAAFELAQEQAAVDALDADVAALATALQASPELRDVIRSPVIPRAELVAAMVGLADEMGLTEIMRGTLGIMAQNRRLFVLPQFLAELRRLSAEARGEMTAEVISAAVLTKAEADRLAKILRERLGKSVKLSLSVDEGLIGGLVVKVGSKMIDTSIRSRLAALEHKLKEVS